MTGRASGAAASAAAYDSLLSTGDGAARRRNEAAIHRRLDGRGAPRRRLNLDGRRVPLLDFADPGRAEGGRNWWPATLRSARCERSPRPEVNRLGGRLGARTAATRRLGGDGPACRIRWPPSTCTPQQRQFGIAEGGRLMTSLVSPPPWRVREKSRPMATFRRPRRGAISSLTIDQRAGEMAFPATTTREGRSWSDQSRRVRHRRRRPSSAAGGALVAPSRARPRQKELNRRRSTGDRRTANASAPGVSRQGEGDVSVDGRRRPDVPTVRFASSAKRGAQMEPRSTSSGDSNWQRQSADLRVRRERGPSASPAVRPESVEPVGNLSAIARLANGQHGAGLKCQPNSRTGPRRLTLFATLTCHFRVRTCRSGREQGEEPLCAERQVGERRVPWPPATNCCTHKRRLCCERQPQERAPDPLHWTARGDAGSTRRAADVTRMRRVATDDRHSFHLSTCRPMAQHPILHLPAPAPAPAPAPWLIVANNEGPSHQSRSPDPRLPASTSSFTRTSCKRRGWRPRQPIDK